MSHFDHRTCTSPLFVIVATKGASSVRHNFFIFLSAAVLLAIAPGPGMLYVLARALGGGRREGLLSALGTFFGGMVHNPLHALVRILDSMRAADGKILVEGFYDDIVPLSPGERVSHAPCCTAPRRASMMMPSRGS